MPYSIRKSIALIYFSLIPGFVFSATIDRQALVTRHNPHLTQIDTRSPFTLGNGCFAFTADVTGMQTLSDLYEKTGIPLQTMARWAWHIAPNPKGYKLEDAFEWIDTHGKLIPYPTNGTSEAGLWLRQNPHDVPLGRIAFADSLGQSLQAADISKVTQTLNLWTGHLTSQFMWHNYEVKVDTVVDSATDTVAVKIKSKAITQGLLTLTLDYPRGYPTKMLNNPPMEWK